MLDSVPNLNEVLTMLFLLKFTITKCLCLMLFRGISGSRVDSAYTSMHVSLRKTRLSETSFFIMVTVVAQLLNVCSYALNTDVSLFRCIVCQL